MNNTIFPIITITLVVTGTIFACVYMRRKGFEKKIAEESEQIEGELQLEDVVAFLRNLNLKKGVDTPFIAKCDSKEFQEITKGTLPPKPGYNLLMIGTFNKEMNKISKYKFIYSLGWSDSLNKTIGEDPMVVLS